jgi:hypothetical protein
MSKNVKYSIKYLHESKFLSTFARYFEKLCPYWVDLLLKNKLCIGRLNWLRN